MTSIQQETIASECRTSVLLANVDREKSLSSIKLSKGIKAQLEKTYSGQSFENEWESFVIQEQTKLFAKRVIALSIVDEAGIRLCKTDNDVNEYYEALGEIEGSLIQILKAITPSSNEIEEFIGEKKRQLKR